VLAVAGIPFELRAAFVTRGRLWGAVHLARRDAGHDFTNQDARALGAITSAVADGIRTSLRLDAARRGDPGGPGLVVLDRSDGVELITPPARPLIDALRAPGLRGDGEVPPTPLLALASHARRYSAGTCAGNAIAVPSRAGWLTLHASLPDGIADGRVAIVLEHAATPLATAVRLEAHGVTSREREVAFLLAKGMSNPEIAETLVLSPYTVQDHVKNLFEKTDVSSRQELIARIFLDDYLPQLTARTPLTTTASFARQGI
jgi:DNA-binding CsgD family transcriptional regulator